MVVDDAAAPAETLHNRHNLTGGLPRTYATETQPCLGQLILLTWRSEHHVRG